MLGRRRLRGPRRFPSEWGGDAGLGFDRLDETTYRAVGSAQGGHQFRDGGLVVRDQAVVGHPEDGRVRILVAGRQPPRNYLRLDKSSIAVVRRPFFLERRDRLPVIGGFHQQDLLPVFEGEGGLEAAKLR